MSIAELLAFLSGFSLFFLDILATALMFKKVFTQSLTEDSPSKTFKVKLFSLLIIKLTLLFPAMLIGLVYFKSELIYFLAGLFFSLIALVGLGYFIKNSGWLKKKWKR